MSNLPITRLLLRSVRPITQEDARDIKTNLANTPGTGQIDIDPERNLIAVMTASQDGGRLILESLKRASFHVEVLEEDTIASERNADPIPGTGSNLAPDRGPATRND